MKTIRQYLKEKLTPEQYDNAVLNIFEETPWDTEVPDLATAMIDGFSWTSMPEGYEYWEEVYDNC